MKNFKLSLVTSCYNAESYLEELANSVFYQNYDLGLKISLIFVLVSEDIISK